MFELDIEMVISCVSLCFLNSP